MLHIRGTKEEIILKEDMAGTPLIFGYSEFTSLSQAIVCNDYHSYWQFMTLVRDSDETESSQGNVP